MSGLLEKCSDKASTLFYKQNGVFASFIFLGGGQFFEHGCYATEEEASDSEVLQSLVRDTADDFRILGIKEFAVAFFSTKTTQLRNIITGATMNMPVPGIAVEEYGAGAPRAGFRAIENESGFPTLAALTYERPSPNSPFAKILSLAASSPAPWEGVDDSKDAAPLAPMDRS